MPTQPIPVLNRSADVGGAPPSYPASALWSGLRRPLWVRLARSLELDLGRQRLASGSKPGRHVQAIYDDDPPSAQPAERRVEGGLCGLGRLALGVIDESDN